MESYSKTTDSDGHTDIGFTLMFSKDNKMPILGGKTAWIQFYNGKIVNKSYCDEHLYYDQSWDNW
jgi:hypothetical protein